ncbi:MAG TPA: acetate--CoA ligase family protein [Dehalococcoidia bacterium]|nr:acetate--CoA ligase family protein [Dehalococcoidia bacterium]
MSAAVGANRLLNEVESKQLLESAGITTASARLARSCGEAVQLATELGFPAVLKIVSDDVAHKSDIGGVRLGLESAEDVERAYDDILKAVTGRQPDARIEGVSVQRMAAPGLEVIIGMSRDPQFGPVMMFGLGGVLVEVLEDVVFRLVPLERRDAVEMLQEIRGSALLDGYRGSPAISREALVDLMLQVSAFIDAHPEISELDLNPVFAYPDGAIAVDARIVITS